MEFRYLKLQQDFTGLKSTIDSLGQQLSDAARDTVAKGTIPNERLAESLSSARRQFDSVRSAVFALAQDLQVDNVPALDDLRSLGSIEILLGTTAKTETQRQSAAAEQQGALSILDRVLSIRHRDSPDFKPLADCLRTARELRSSIATTAWPQAHPDTAILLSGDHVFNALLTLLSEGSDLDDEKYAQLEEMVSGAFGRTFGVALSRGKLAVGDGSPQTPAESKPAPVEVRQETKPTAPEPNFEQVPETRAVAVEAKREEPPKPAPVVVEEIEEPALPEPPPHLEIPGPVAPLEEIPALALSREPETFTTLNDTVELRREDVQHAIAAKAEEAAERAPEVFEFETPVIPDRDDLKSVAVDATVALAEAVGQAGDMTQTMEATPVAVAATAEAPAAKPVTPKTEERTMDATTGGAKPQRWGFWRGNR